MKEGAIYLPPEDCSSWWPFNIKLIYVRLSIVGKHWYLNVIDCVNAIQREYFSAAYSIICDYVLHVQSRALMLRIIVPINLIGSSLFPMTECICTFLGIANVNL